MLTSISKTKGPNAIISTMAVDNNSFRLIESRRLELGRAFSNGGICVGCFRHSTD